MRRNCVTSIWPISIEDRPKCARSCRISLQALRNGTQKELTADLHRIAELADQNGLRLLLERAVALKKEFIPKQEAEGQHLNPKHVALRTFLEHRDVFEAASDFLAIETRISLTEFSGPDENVHPEINDQVRKDFEREAGQLLVRSCREGGGNWHGAGPERHGGRVQAARSRSVGERSRVGQPSTRRMVI